jgi:hypothetical protein
VLLRHGRRAAARGLARLRDLTLGKEDDVEADLPADARGRGERGTELRDPHAIRVPGKRRQREAELPCELLGDAHAMVSQPGQRAGSAAELDGQAVLREIAQARARVEQRDEPPRRHEAERGRHGMLEQRPGDHRGVAMVAREDGAGRRGRLDVAQHMRNRLA